MLSKCANPACSTPLLYLREGKIFKVETEAAPYLLGGKKPARRVEHFWLCGACSAELTLTFQQGIVSVLPKAQVMARRAAAS